MSEHKTCEIGISYEKFNGVGSKCPCFSQQESPPVPCEHAVYPTAEEIAARDAEFAARSEKVGAARKAIEASIGHPWKNGMLGVSGTVNCPACNGKATLRFSRSGYNGHIAAACTTPDCVRWME